MMDALGEPQSVLVLGGTSEIALATVRALPRGRLRRVVLAGRPGAGLESAAAALTSDGIAGVATAVAVALASINVAGGFLVTQRMLEMFKKKQPKASSGKGH